MNFDAVAPLYRYFEYAAFGKTLERRRFQFLAELGDAQRVVILGDGDGRFTARFLAFNHKAHVDYVELSAKMIALAAKRIKACDRVRFIHADARTFAFPNQTYDLIVTHFFLDCFSPSEAAAMIAALACSASPDARWLISEFNRPEVGWKSVHAAVWLKAMYAFFRVAAGLRAKHLPPYRNEFLKCGFSLDRRVEERAGLVVSEMWRFTPG